MGIIRLEANAINIGMKFTMTKNKVISVILCGGSGTRLWPLSREENPKQFVEIADGQNLFLSTLQRSQSISDESIIICNNKHLSLVEKYNNNHKKSLIVCEPVSKNTAPAINAAVHLANQIDSDSILVIMPSDHKIDNVEAFNNAIRSAVSLANKGYLICIGVECKSAETGYGYIKCGGKIDELGWLVDCFIEKPELDLAEKLYKDSDCLWNAGIFVVSTRVLHELFFKLTSNIFDLTKSAIDSAKRTDSKIILNNEFWHMCPSISIDYAIVEKARNVATVKLQCDWTDLGSWDSLYHTLTKDVNLNHIEGDVIQDGVSNSLIYSPNKLAAVVGCDNLVVVNTSDCLLVCKRGESQRVKNVVEKMKLTLRKEVVSTTKVMRPWGFYESILHGAKYQVKKITVFPGEKLSLQKHHRRSEHWTIVHGSAEVQIGNNVSSLKENQSAYIPVEEIHRLSNIGKENLILIEVQFGEYLGEDDIERLEDKYHRHSN